MRDAEKDNYIPWYRLAEIALGDLVPHPESDSHITSWVSKANWLMVPTLTETNMREARNRPDPNIYFTLGDERIDIGLACNTLAAIDKMRNLLRNYHAKERAEFLSYMKTLDDGFVTEVTIKNKPYHFSQSPIFETDYTIQANMVDDLIIAEIFRHVDDMGEGSSRI